MRKCNFEKIIRKLLKSGKVYIGVSAGSIVVGKTIQTAVWGKDKNLVNLKNLKGLNLVPFDIFCHYQPEDAEIIKQKIKNPRKKGKKIKNFKRQPGNFSPGQRNSINRQGRANYSLTDLFGNKICIYR